MVSAIQNLHLQTPSQANKRKFFQQQAFDSNRILKKWVCLFSLALFAYEVLLTQIFLPREVVYAKPRTTILSTFLFAIALIAYYVSIFKFFEKTSPKILTIRCGLMWLTILCFSIAQGLKAYDEIFDRVEHHSIEKWFYSLIKSRNEVWTILLIDILVPIWYIKLIVPVSYWITQIVAYCTLGLEYKAMIFSCFALSTIFTAILWAMKNFHEWKVFLGRSNIEAWDDVHRYILDKVPDAIAVIDSDANVIYSNSTFKTFCNDKLENLSQKLIYCKKTCSNSFTEPVVQNTKTNVFQSPHSEDSQEDLTFLDILQRNMKSLIKGDHKLENYLTFTAKMPSDTDAKQLSRSYEIKLGSLSEYNKMILILSDTTQRDLAIFLDIANQYKDRLLAAVSHDLRAPINGSMSLIEGSIEHESVPSFIKEQYLIPAQRSCKFLLHLTNDILDFSQINARKLRMNFETSPLIETIKSCYQLLEMQAIKKKIEFQLVLDNNLPEMFTTDHNRLSQVIINLLTNAMKFTFTGSVTLSARLVNSLIEIKVKDTGIGIQDKDKEKLFQEFTRIEYEQKGINIRGVGLGLVIANKLAKRLGPTSARNGINMTSTYGKGSTFAFLLEDKKQMSGEKEINPNRENSSIKTRNYDEVCLTTLTYREEDFLYQKISEGDLSRYKSLYYSSTTTPFNTRPRLLSRDNSIHLLSPKKPKKKQFIGRILIVDDDAINIIAFETILRQYGVVTDAAYNGEEAVKKVLQNNDYTDYLKQSDCENREKQCLTKGYQMIFMDYEMPVMDGLEATKKLRALMQGKEINNIPIIGCTGHQEEKVQEKGIVSGMVGMVHKPPIKEKLLEILERYMCTAY